MTAVPAKQLVVGLGGRPARLGQAGMHLGTQQLVEAGAVCLEGGMTERGSNREEETPVVVDPRALVDGAPVGPVDEVDGRLQPACRVTDSLASHRDARRQPTQPGDDDGVRSAGGGRCGTRPSRGGRTTPEHQLGKHQRPVAGGPRGPR